ncbi:MAG: 3-hydroxyacyl-CoA dehydrogenase NAD-binding domain-containing protein [Porticoccaceae bacterium]|nr:3-hydroxyacyl-CoA dehydrogenase NAD-binding domain-containing protein [Porticoccaceae bacterium]MDG2501580.1 3-hydroxyacyl-CoA dehydrogenase NAD-binding domain-containing protein [Porticoccaceae bacterium]
MQGKIEKRGSIGIIWIDNPPVNAISHAVREGLVSSVEAIAADESINAVVLACRGRTFMAGADITEFGSGHKPPSLSAVVDVISASPKIIVAALFGTTFGGGLEVALGCDYRIALPTAKIGLPEVKLGIIPGAQGTQRLPRLSGVEFALKMMTTGDPVSATKAQSVGVIDRLIEGDIVEGAVAFAEELLANNAPLRKIQEMVIDPKEYHDEYFDTFRQTIARKTRGMNAPECAVRAVQAAVNLPFKEGVAFERKMTRECVADPQSKALQYVFFAERQATKVPGLPKDIELTAVNAVGIIGAGTMGGGIAMNFANVGIPVTLLEMSQDALKKGLSTIRKNYEATAKKGRITGAQVEERMALLKGSTEYGDLVDMDLVIEAVFEKMDIKKQVFKTLSGIVRPDTILASNTSYLDIDEIATVVDRPERMLGMHFFSPANIMRMLEIVRAEKTAPEILATVLKLGKRINKVGAVAGVCYGFIGNRMLRGYSHEANMLVLEGAAPEKIDSVLYHFGMPMGVIAMGDMAGLDIGYYMRQNLNEGDYDVRTSFVYDALVEMGRYGQKTGAGVYDYEPGNRDPIPSPITQKLIKQAAEKFGIEQREISDEEIVERCFLSLFNIGCHVLEEGMAYRASDIDIVYINGYGFPAWRGGPMYWAEHTIGLEAALNRINQFADRYGRENWTPAPMLERLVAEGGSLRDIQND